MSGPRGFDQMWTRGAVMGEPFDEEEEAPMLERATTPKPAPVNTTGKPTVDVELPHLLVSDELVERAVRAGMSAGMLTGQFAGGMRAALSAVAPELWQAGYDAGKRWIGDHPSLY